jgi:hypothetical protein
MNKTEAYGHIEAGTLHIHRREVFDADIKTFPDCDVELTVKKRGKRSLPQNSYYWSTVVFDITAELIRVGNRTDRERVHEMLKRKFNPVYIYNADGEVIDVEGGSTVEMNKEEFSNYIEKVREWAATDLEITIPDPGTQPQLFAV